MEQWKKVISEDTKCQMWVHMKQPRLSIEKLEEEEKKFAIQLLSEDGQEKKLLAKCENLETAMKWAEGLDTKPESVLKD